jgi:hypothetical protein
VSDVDKPEVNADLSLCEFAFICGYTLYHNVDANSIAMYGAGQEIRGCDGR